MVMGKNKGNTFERKIYKQLRSFFEGTTTSVKRTLGSGSTDEGCDINVENEKRKFVIECKHYNSLSETLKVAFCHKLEDDALTKNKTSKKTIVPVLIYKTNFQPIKCRVKVLYMGRATWVEMNYNDWLECLSTANL